jgi:UDP-N-acetylmuramoyl-L-alanyl-D-glutamate--2,6-diaminopimelate ligase
MTTCRQSLKTLLADLPIPAEVSGEVDGVTITGVQYDSRAVKPGDLFVCLSGINTDGHKYIPNAVQAGAAAVVGTQPAGALSVPYIRVADAREAMAWFSAGLYDHPGRKLTVIGVTGTDGKTTTSNMLYQILKTAGIRAGLISTVNAMIGDDVIDTGFHVTTPEAPDVQRYLALMVDAGLTHVVLETTSHGLAQHRVTGCEYDIAVVTNVTHEHLDYHGTYESYLAAKGLLFEMLTKTHAKVVMKTQGGLNFAILNADDRSFDYLRSLVKENFVSYSVAGRGTINAEDIQASDTGIDFIVKGEGIAVPVHCPIPGLFNVSNSLAAFCAAVKGLGIDPQIAARAIAVLPGVPGRMEIIDLGQDFIAIVDFAHTPNALKVALDAVRPMTKGRVIAVFGSAGLRDREKRKMMADVSIRGADLTILTAEDPRTESLDDILTEMAGAAVAAGGVEGVTFHRVPDRGAAIRKGLQMASPGDLVIACGKGHEQSMCFGTVEYPWDDRIAMRAALGELLKKEAPEMPKLPTSK